MKYLTVKEAAETFDKPKMVIRRLIEILKIDEQLKQQWLKEEESKKGVKYLIAKKALALEFGKPQPEKKGETKPQKNQAPKKSEADIILNLKAHIADLKEQLNISNELNKQLLQSLRMEQVKTLSKSDKEKIINVLNDK